MYKVSIKKKLRICLYTFITDIQPAHFYNYFEKQNFKITLFMKYMSFITNVNYLYNNRYRCDMKILTLKRK